MSRPICRFNCNRRAPWNVTWKQNIDEKTPALSEGVDETDVAILTLLFHIIRPYFEDLWLQKVHS